MKPDLTRVALPHNGDRSYDIATGEGLLAEAGAMIATCAGRRKVCIISDATVAKLYETKLKQSCEAAGHTVLPSITVPAGEGSKTWDRLGQVVDGLLERKADRKTLVLALGGGVVGDLAGFAAAVTLRGLDYVQIPTTLLAMVDSAVGGKTAVDHARGKNLIGAFHQPLLVISDLATLDTLPPRELRAGYAETVKYGLLGDAAFYDWCEANGQKVLSGDRAAQTYAVKHACEMKADIVRRDEKEAGVRALLNLGHTFGHALEAAQGFDHSLLHGEAVAVGMTLAARLSEQLGMVAAGTAARIEKHFAACNLPTAAVLRGGHYNPADLMGYMRQDKKAEDGKLTLVLMRGIGQATVEKGVAEAPVLKTWTDALQAKAA